MKITIESESDHSDKRSVSIKCSDCTDMRELAAVFAGACVAYGYSPERVKKYVYSEMLDGTFKSEKI